MDFETVVLNPNHFRNQVGQRKNMQPICISFGSPSPFTTAPFYARLFRGLQPHNRLITYFDVAPTSPYIPFLSPLSRL